MNTDFLNDYDERVIALANFLDINLEPEFDEADSYYVANREDYETDEEFKEAQAELDEEKKQDEENAVQEIMDELDDITEGYRNNLYEYHGQEYLVLTDDEADCEMDESLDNYIEEVIMPEIPEAYQNYFDEDAWKQDASYDGRGHIIATYDGCEYEQDGYYIYRVG